MAVGSMDVKALDPSLLKEWVKRILMQMLLETEVLISETDWMELALYLAHTHSQDEIHELGLSDDF